MRRKILLLTAIPLILASFVMAPRSALADNTTCSISPSAANCDGVSPAKSGCANDASLVKESFVNSYEGNPLGYIKLWYSSKCETTWGQGVASYYSDGALPIVQVVRNSDGNFYSCTGNYQASYRGWECSTVMVYAGQSASHSNILYVWDPYDNTWLNVSTHSF
jgi:hypothetical protein